jgi:hypothetical protein
MAVRTLNSTTPLGVYHMHPEDQAGAEGPEGQAEEAGKE